MKCEFGNSESNCGIDRAAAILLGKEGAKVTVHGTDEDELRVGLINLFKLDNGIQF
jgi:NAD(P)-dependent dehydrogenase (short-subunit alcohol dehydrogenase family)